MGAEEKTNIHWLSLSETTTCSTCGVCFKTPEHLLEHKTLHDTLLTGPFKCGHCNKKYATRACLRKHMMSHFEILTFDCKLCDKFFPTQQQLTSHAAVHREGVNAFLCTICGRATNSLVNLREHEETHTLGRPHECDVKGCTYATKTRSCLRKHKRRVHFAKPLSCHVCGKTVKAFSMDAHLKIHDPNRTRPHKCDFCGKHFASVSVLRTHKAHRHEDARNFECELCKKRFNYKWLVRAHITKVHLKLSKQFCDICGKTLGSWQSFRQHQLIHTGGKPYSCEVCNISFRQHSALSKHKESHKK